MPDVMTPADTVPVPHNILDLLFSQMVTETAEYMTRRGLDGTGIGDPFDMVLEWLLATGREQAALAVVADLVIALRALKPEGSRPLPSEIVPSAALCWRLGGNRMEQRRVQVMLEREIVERCGPGVESR
jgi:hypothetical protein